MKNHKKYILFFSILLILVPLGIIVPDYFKAGNAWGEWSVEQVKEKTGFEPEGMKKNADRYKAPLLGYTWGKESPAWSVKSSRYFISAIVGLSMIIILTFGLIKIMARSKK